MGERRVGGSTTRSGRRRVEESTRAPSQAWSAGWMLDCGSLLNRTVLRRHGIGRHLRATDIPAVDELPVQDVEVRWAGEDGSGRAIAKVVLAAERRFTTEGAEALTHHHEPRSGVDGNLDQRSYTASNSARPASRAVLDRRDRTSTTGGRSTASRPSPSRRRSCTLTESTAPGSTHPEPVVVITTRVRLPNPPARARSSTASRARCYLVGELTAPMIPPCP